MEKQIQTKHLSFKTWLSRNPRRKWMAHWHWGKGLLNSSRRVYSKSSYKQGGRALGNHTSVESQDRYKLRRCHHREVWRAMSREYRPDPGTQGLQVEPWLTGTAVISDWGYPAGRVLGAQDPNHTPFSALWSPPGAAHWTNQAEQDTEAAAGVLHTSQPQG